MTSAGIPCAPSVLNSVFYDYVDSTDYDGHSRRAPSVLNSMFCDYGPNDTLGWNTDDVEGRVVCSDNGGEKVPSIKMGKPMPCAWGGDVARPNQVRRGC